MIELTAFVVLLWTNFAEVVATPNASVKVNLPINPVETGAVFALHCQVSNLDDGQNVQIYKTTPGRSQQLSVDEAIVVTEERLFLARRQLSDGSVIYFLSIIDVSIEDEAEYSCKIVSTYPTLTEVAKHSAKLDVMYYPSVSNPICDEIHSSLMYEGDKITLSCNSEIGSPAVSLRWKRTSDESYLVDKETTDDRVYSTATITVRQNTDDGAVFLCEIYSTAFPGETQSCHVGPITVRRHPSRPVIPDLTTVAPNVPKQTISFEHGVPVTEQDCKDVCDALAESTVTYWVAGTIIAAVLALLFCTVCLVLLMKFCKHTSEDFPDYSPPIEDAEKIYVEVESKRDSGKMYMSLVKPYPETNFPQVPQKM